MSGEKQDQDEVHSGVTGAISPLEDCDTGVMYLPPPWRPAVKVPARDVTLSPLITGSLPPDSPPAELATSLCETDIFFLAESTVVSRGASTSIYSGGCWCTLQIEKSSDTYAFPVTEDSRSKGAYAYVFAPRKSSTHGEWVATVAAQVAVLLAHALVPIRNWLIDAELNERQMELLRLIVGDQSKLFSLPPDCTVSVPYLIMCHPTSNSSAKVSFGAPFLASVLRLSDESVVQTGQIRLLLTPRTSAIPKDSWIGRMLREIFHRFQFQECCPDDLSPKDLLSVLQQAHCVVYPSSYDFDLLYAIPRDTLLIQYRDRRAQALTDVWLAAAIGIPLYCFNLESEIPIGSSGYPSGAAGSGSSSIRNAIESLETLLLTKCQPQQVPALAIEVRKGLQHVSLERDLDGDNDSEFLGLRRAGVRVRAEEELTFYLRLASHLSTKGHTIILGAEDPAIVLAMMHGFLRQGVSRSLTILVETELLNPTQELLAPILQSLPETIRDRIWIGARDAYDSRPVSSRIPTDLLIVPRLREGSKQGELIRSLAAEIEVDALVVGGITPGSGRVEVVLRSLAGYLDRRLWLANHNSHKVWELRKQERLVSIILPSRQRPELCIRTIHDCSNSVHDPSCLEFLCYFDSDDPTRCAVQEQFATDPRVRSFVFPPVGYRRLFENINVMCAESRGRWLFLWNDDAVFDSCGWDEVFVTYGQRVCLVSPVVMNMPDYPGAIFPAIPRTWFNVTGCFSGQTHNDTWVEDIAKRIGVFFREPRISTIHERFDETGINYDETYRKREYMTEEFFNEHFTAERVRQASLLIPYL